MVQRSQRRWNVIAISAVIVAAVLALTAVSRLNVPAFINRDSVQLISTSTGLDRRPLRGERLTAEQQELDQQQLEHSQYTIKVGVYANSTSELELNVPSFTGSGYIWLIWEEPFQRYLNQSGTSVENNLLVLNALLSNASVNLTPVGPPQVMADGSHYQLLSFRGRYYIDHSSFRRYPFLSLSLPIAVEPNDTDGQLSYQNLRLIPDQQNSGIGLYADIIGWLVQGWSIAEYRHHYDTNFGLPGGVVDYSQIIYEIALGTSAWSSFWRLLLPLAIVMIMVLLVFKVRADEQDARSSIPVTVLLTLVFLQQAYRDRLPDLPYLTFLDQIYVVAYVVTLLAFVLVIWIGRRYAEAETLADESIKSLMLKRIERLDVIWPLAVVSLGAAAIAVIWVMIPQTV